MAIRGFKGPNRWLSNFWPCLIIDNQGLTYRSVEHAYQATKFEYGSEMFEKIRTADTPAQAKKLGKSPGKRDDFDDIKEHLMYRLLKQKFHPETELARWLNDTGNQDIIEENKWGDTFWGVCNGEGKNVLGKLLMQVREELRR